MAEPALEQDITVTIEGDDPTAIRVDPVTGQIDVPETGVVVNLRPDIPSPDQDDDPEKFYENLALKMGDSELGVIANDLMEGIESDIRSRTEHLQNLSLGMTVIGLKLEDPSDSNSTAQVKGMSVVRSPLLLEAVLRGWANAVAELLPAAGPVKVRNDKMPKVRKPFQLPPAVANAPNIQSAAAAMYPGMLGKDDTDQGDTLADALEADMNRFFTDTMTEYYPDTSHMLLWGTQFGGSGFKKVYRCPMRRRPVSESVPVEKFIVSNSMKDLRSSTRITHQIDMLPSVMRRMMRAGAYRDVKLAQPSAAPTDPITQKTDEIQGTRSLQDRPQDQPYNLYETQCELDLPEYAPQQFKDQKIPLPYLVTMDADTQAILSIRRDWRPDDEECQRQRMYVKYPYVPGPGFYGTGLLNILGNATVAMTLAWRLALDAGQKASFPAFLFLKGGERQNTNNFAAGPGEGIPIDASGAGGDIRNIVMASPFHDVTPGLMTMIDKVTEASQRVGSTADNPVGEGTADIPVGTIMAQIEQATKVMAAAHKGMHTAQAEEIQMVVDLFRQYPEDFWRFNKTKSMPWDAETLQKALDDHYLIPVSDPNVPSQIHRIAENMALVQLKSSRVFGPFLDTKEVLTRVLNNALHIPADGLIIDPPPDQGPQQDPAKLLQGQAANKKAEASILDAQTKAKTAVGDQVLKGQELQQKGRDSLLDLKKEEIIHANDGLKARHELGLKAESSRQDHGLAMRDTLLAERKQHADEVAQRHGQLMDLHGLVMPPEPPEDQGTV
jgi:hypothetical protein